MIISGHAVEIVNYNNSLPEGTDKNLDLSLYIIEEKGNHFKYCDLENLRISKSRPEGTDIDLLLIYRSEK